VRDAARRHDTALAARGLVVWAGAEPTFTRKDSQDAAWLYTAEGDDKEARAKALLRALASRLPGAVRLVHAIGRQYPDEAEPRFAFGALWRRGATGSGPVDDRLDGPAVEPPLQAPGDAWLTVTPDPAVVEVNTAPAADLATFQDDLENVYAAADAAGLSPVRYRYDGQVVESGGGGQITLGGPTPEGSPFFLRPATLPRLLRLFNRHPSLSYLFAPACIGSASQGPRPDEGVRERFEELGLCLDLLEARGDAVTREDLWAALAPLLVDASGNSHRAELNVEKLWNPYLEGRGRMGVVEFRAFGMPPTAAELTARAALLRALAARAATASVALPLVDRGAALHDRYGLPALLLDDLREVLADLDAHGLGLGPALEEPLLAPPQPLARVELPGASLAITPAREFWPLMGDVASQERSGSRLVDSSSERVEALVTTTDGGGPGLLAAAGRPVPLRVAGGARFVAGIRARAFVPSPGLHPGLPPADPLSLRWEREGRALEIDLHRWIPGGGAYPGLPGDAAEAARRRRERVVVREGTPREEALPAPERGDSCTVDLRRLAGTFEP
jgi:uncharacterized protein (DUF2126 family)